MLEMITPARYGAYVDDLFEMHRLRYRVFKERLDWDVETSGDLEIDSFDALQPTYLLQRHEDGTIGGAVRLLPTTGPYMLRDTFPILLGGSPAPATERVWESSRFCLDTGHSTETGSHGVTRATFELFAGLIEFGLLHDLTDIVTVTDVRLERILRRVGWPLRRCAEPVTIGATRAVAGFGEVSEQSLDRIRKAGALDGPVLHAPDTLQTAA